MIKKQIVEIINRTSSDVAISETNVHTLVQHRMTFSQKGSFRMVSYNGKFLIEKII